MTNKQQKRMIKNVKEHVQVKQSKEWIYSVMRQRDIITIIAIVEGIIIVGGIIWLFLFQG